MTPREEADAKYLAGDDSHYVITNSSGPTAGTADTGTSTKVGGVYNSSAPVLDSGDRGDLQLDVNSNVKVTAATLIAGEDLTNDVQKVEQRFTLTNCTADTLVKTGAGFLHTITVAQTDAAPTAGTIIIYDNTAESGTIIQTINFTTAVFQPFSLHYDGTFSTGLYVGFTTTNDVNVTLSWR